MKFSHYPVMYKNVIKYITPYTTGNRKIRIADCNLGLGGHSNEIIKTFPNAFVDAYQLDLNVAKYYQQNYMQQLSSQQQKRLTIIPKNYTTILNAPQNYDIVLADLGYNSMQLQTGQGFSWQKDTFLDMRYDKNSQLRNGYSIVNESSKMQLMEILKNYGQLKGVGQIADKIIENRPIKTTSELRNAVVGCFQQSHPRRLSQIFQAFRITVNGELNDISKLCSSFLTKVNKNGLIMIITFHSLERLTIQKFLHENRGKFSRLMTKTPQQSQINENKRSSSAQLLYFTKK